MSRKRLICICDQDRFRYSFHAHRKEVDPLSVPVTFKLLIQHSITAVLQARPSILTEGSVTIYSNKIDTEGLTLPEVVPTKYFMNWLVCCQCLMRERAELSPLLASMYKGRTGWASYQSSPSTRTTLGSGVQHHTVKTLQ